MHENLVIADAVSTMDDFVDVHGEYSTKEAWQTLKAAVLAQQTNNSAMDAIACEYLNQLITRYDSTHDVMDRDFLVADLLNEWKRKQQHQ